MFWDELRKLNNELEKIFDNFGFSSFYFDQEPRRRVIKSNFREPLTDIWESDNEIIATLELPGVEKKDIDIDVTDRGLEIKVEKKKEEKVKKEGFYRLERDYSGFYKIIPLPDHALTDKIKASYKNGVLEIRIPKKKVKESKKKIKVE